MIATSLMRTPLALHRAEGERHNIVAVIVGGERDHGQLDVHAELKLLGIVFGEPALDANHVVELNEADPEGHEVVASGSCVRRPGGKPCVVHATSVPLRGNSNSV